MKDTENRRICRALAATSLVPHPAAYDGDPAGEEKRQKLRNALKRRRRAAR